MAPGKKTESSKKTFKNSGYSRGQKDQKKGKKKKRKSTDSNSTPESANTNKQSSSRKRDNMSSSPSATKTSRSRSPSTKKKKASSTSLGGDNFDGVSTRSRAGNSASSSSARSSGGKSAGDESSAADLEKSALSMCFEAHVGTDDEREENTLLVDTAAKSMAEIMPSSPVPKVLQYFESEERKINNSMWPFLWALQYNKQDKKIEVGMPDVNHNDMDINLALGILCSVCGIPAIGTNGRSSNETKLYLEPGTDVKVMMVPFVDDKARTVSADNQSFTRQFSFPDSLFYSPL